MKKINFHTIAFLAALIAVSSFSWNFSKETFLFFGFAENKELEISMKNPVTVKQIMVTPGLKVVKGQILMEITRSELDLAQSDLHHEVAQLRSQLNIWDSGLRSSINRLQGEKAARESEIQSQIAQLESELSINQSLIKDLQSIKPAQDNLGRSPNKIRIEGLKNELRLMVRPIETQINQLNHELYAKDNPIKIQIEKLQNQLGYADVEEEKLTITAPNDGIVGSILCEVGETISGFTTLVTFYEENPTEVKAYVLESLVLKVKLGDEVSVISSTNPKNECQGKVIGLGSRIIEIPERLRKMPTFKTYGREVIIQIPGDNSFLQKEKVVLKMPEERLELRDLFVSAFDNLFSQTAAVPNL